MREHISMRELLELCMRPSFLCTLVYEGAWTTLHGMQKVFELPKRRPSHFQARNPCTRL